MFVINKINKYGLKGKIITIRVIIKFNNNKKKC